MKSVVTFLVAFLAMTSFALAQPPGHAKRKGPKWDGKPQILEQKGEALGEAVIDAVTEEVTGEEEPETPKGMPPGLSKKGGMPPGIAKQDKVPPGWNKGEKKGWDRDAAAETDERRPLKKFIRGLFRSGE